MYTFVLAFLLLTTVHAEDANRAATISMKKVAMGEVFRNYYLRTDGIDSLCITKVMTNTARQEACTVTVDCTSMSIGCEMDTYKCVGVHPMETPNPTWQVVVDCEPTGMPEPWCKRPTEECERW
jgi:hypothetical protein